MRRDNRRKNSTGSFIGPALLAIFFVLNAATGSDSENFIVLLAVAVIAGIIGLAVAVLKKWKKSPESTEMPLKIRRKREAALEDKPLSSRKAAPAVYNERSAEELFLRDKQKRLEQLEVFLKNGIVDKAEYNLLKKRYENYSYERN